MRSPTSGLAALAYLLLLLGLSVLSPYLAPHDPRIQDLTNQYQRPNFGTHLLGTDRYGHDELSQLMYGARYSLIAAVIGTTVAVAVGTPLGMIAGYLGRTVEGVASFLFDGLMAVPGLILTLTIIAVVGSGLTRAMIVVGVIFSPPFFRLARAATRDVKSRTFIEASTAIGCSNARLILRHVVPNALTTTMVQVAFTAGACIAAEAGLSYLGLGVRPPNASWGSMLSTASEDIYANPYLVYFPGIAIALTVLAFSLIGDWMRMALTSTRRSEGL